MKKAKRYLASLLQQRFMKSVRSASEQELERFLNENGWVLYDNETMIKNFLEWRKKESNHKPKLEVIS
jgi:hypothetical protein